MILRLQASLDLSEDPENGLELNSLFLKKRLGISSQHPSINLFLRDLQRGIPDLGDLSPFAKKYDLDEKSLKDILGKLSSHNLLIQEKNTPLPPQDALYDRQERFFTSFEKQGISGKAIHQNLQNRTIVIVGLGGYGSWAALLCSRMGVKNIIGIDFDHVEITNLHRQVLYSKMDLGKFKIEACRRKIQECDEQINFVGHNLNIQNPKDLHSIVKDADLILNPFSYVPIHHAERHPAGIVAKAALDMDKPCLTFGGSWIGPLSLPGKSPCYFCAIHALSDRTDLNPKNRNPHVQKRAFAPPIATCCSLAVFEAARFLSDCDESQVLNGIMQLDILSFANNHFFALNRDRECKFCSPHITQNKRDQ